MFQFIFGAEVDEWYMDLQARASQGDNDARLMANKLDYIMARVEAQGLRAGSKFIKDLKGKENDNLYELRPFDERVFCCLWDGNHFVLLSHYTKDQNNTDERELIRARRLRDQWMKHHPIEKLDRKDKKKRR